MISDVQEAVEKLKELQEHFDPAQLGGPNQKKELNQEQLIEAREAIEKLKSERGTIAEWHDALQNAGLDEIEALLNDGDIDSLASFDREAVYNEEFAEIDVGDEEKLARQQEIADNHAAEQYDEKFYAAKDAISALSGKMNSCVDSLDELL